MQKKPVPKFKAVKKGIILGVIGLLCVGGIVSVTRYKKEPVSVAEQPPAVVTEHLKEEDKSLPSIKVETDTPDTLDSTTPPSPVEENATTEHITILPPLPSPSVEKASITPSELPVTVAEARPPKMIKKVVLPTNQYHLPNGERDLGGSSSRRQSSAPSVPTNPIVPPKQPTTPEVEPPSLPLLKEKISLETTGIISVDGFYYALISSQEPLATNLQYSISGTEVTPTPVTSSGRMLKVELPDQQARTLSIKNGEDTVTIKLQSLANSEFVAEEERNEFSPTPIAPAIVFGKKEMPLEWYQRKIVKATTEEPFVKSSTLYGAEKFSVQQHISIPVSHAPVDTVSSATTNVPNEIAKKKIIATTVFPFDMIVNYSAIDAVGGATPSVTAVLQEWDVAEKTVAIDATQTLQVDYNNYTALRRTSPTVTFTSEAVPFTEKPKYVKYLLSSGIYGMKAQFSTEAVDDTEHPPTVSAPNILKDNDLVLYLESPNDTWLNYITSVKIKHTTNTSYYYHDTMKIVNDQEIQLKKGEFGPLRNTGDYHVSIEAYGYPTIEVPFSVVLEAPNFQYTWMNNNDILKLKCDRTSYNSAVESITVNGKELVKGTAFWDNSWYDILIKGYTLTPGENTIIIKAPNFMDATITIITPDDFSPPQQPPAFIAEDLIVGTNSPIRFVLTGDRADDWVSKIQSITINNTAVPVTWTYENGTLVILPTKVFGDQTYTLTVSATGYSDITCSLHAKKIAPTLTGTWATNQDFVVTSSVSSYFFRWYNSSVTLNEKPLELNVDYTIKDRQLILSSSLFQAQNHYVLICSTPTYTKATLTFTTPDDFVVPKEAPVFDCEEVALGKDIVFTVTGQLEWKNAIQKIIIQKSDTIIYEVDRSSIHFDDDSITAPYNEQLRYVGTYQIMIEATGYQNATCSIDVKKMPPILDSAFQPNGRLKIWDTTSNYSFYLTQSNIKEVWLNDRKLDATKDYTLSDSVLLIEPTYFVSGETVTISLKNPKGNYVTAQLKILVPLDYVQPLLPPEIGHIDATLGEDIEIDSDHTAWLAGIQKVKMKKATSEFVPTIITTDTQLTVTYNTFFSRKGAYTLVIESKGYSDCVVDVSVIKEVPPDEFSMAKTDAGLEISSSDAGYFFQYVEKMIVNGRALLSEEYRTSYIDLVIDYSVFSENDTFQIEIELAPSQYYKPVKLTYRKPILPNSPMALDSHTSEEVEEAIEKNTPDDYETSYETIEEDQLDTQPESDGDVLENHSVTPIPEDETPTEQNSEPEIPVEEQPSPTICLEEEA